ncbi:MAG: hydrolase TatD [Flavobacteriales bacterium]|nr:hydrolase TatD [Flavobacteriales bacterium]|tara:strand:- start:1136 stop:1912 length:777 start_codon:yes stop_codon:yes gene_type:complete
MEMIDTHTHLYSEQFDEDRDAMIQRALNEGVKRFFLPNIDSNSIEGMKDLVAKYPNNCYPMMGLHPCSVGENIEQELALVEKELASNKYIAVGEIGIDLYWDQSFQHEQEVAFKKQIEWAKKLELPIVIHCRKAFDEILTILDEVNDEQLSGVFHCFTGSLEQANHILNYGDFKLGIGGVVTFKNSGLDKVVEQLNLKDLVLETDAPYIAPVPFRGKRNESAYVSRVAEKLAEIFQLPLTKIAQQTTANALEIFKINE